MNPPRFAAAPPFKTDAEGRPLCRGCGVQVKKPRRTWCSKKCVDDFLVTFSGSVARGRVRERDNGVCAACKLDTRAVRRRIKDVVADAHTRSPRIGRGLDRFLAALYIGGAAANRYFESGAWWQADHVVPVAEGGGSCGLDGLRTLCTLCHNAETKALAQRRARARIAGA